MPMPLKIIMANPAGRKARRQSNAKRRLSMSAKARVDKAPKALRQDRTTQISTGAISREKACSTPGDGGRHHQDDADRGVPLCGGCRIKGSDVGLVGHEICMMPL